MRTIRFIFSAFFFLSLVNGTAHSAFLNEAAQDSFEKKIEVAKSIQSLDQDQGDSDDFTKRKRRPRGIEVPVPQIPDLSFDRLYSYTQINFPKESTFYGTFFLHVHGKRGPPSA